MLREQHRECLQGGISKRGRCPLQGVLETGAEIVAIEAYSICFG